MFARPRASAVPPNVVVNVVSFVKENWFYYLLVLNNKFLEVKVHFDLKTIESEDEDRTVPISPIFAEHRHTIATLLHTADYSQDVNYAHMVQAPDGGYRLIRRKKGPTYGATCAGWAPMVTEHEFEITDYRVSCSDLYAGGVWEGRPVDVYINHQWFRGEMIDKVTRGYRILDGLDLAYEFLAHVVRDGQIIGMLTEPAEGRPVEFRDRAKVFDAIAKLRSRNIFIWLNAHCITIWEGKVRFDPEAIQEVSIYPDSEIDEVFDREVWPQLDVIFAELKTKSGSGNITLRCFPGIRCPLQTAGSPSPSLSSNFPFPFIVMEHAYEIANLFDYYRENRRQFIRAKKRIKRREEDRIDIMLELVYEKLLPHLPLDLLLPPEKERLITMPMIPKKNKSEFRPSVSLIHRNHHTSPRDDICGDMTERGSQN